MIIGVTGYARSGKDTVGEYLVNHHGFTRFAFADAVRECALALDPLLMVGHSHAFPGGWSRLSVYVDLVGWDRAKVECDEVRRILQQMGTEVGRMVFGPNVWIDIVDQRSQGVEDVVITDVRFANEAEYIRSKGGVVVRVERAGVKPANSHASEALDFEVDATIYNSGGLDDLYETVDILLRTI